MVYEALEAEILLVKEVVVAWTALTWAIENLQGLWGQLKGHVGLSLVLL